TGYNVAATHQTGEPAASAGSVGNTAWWSWRAPVSGTVSIDLSGSDASFPVTVFTGAMVSALEPIAADSGAVSFEAVEGQTYQIAVGDASGVTGAIKLKLEAPVLELPLLETLPVGQDFDK